MYCVCVNNEYDGAWFEGHQICQDRIQPSGLCKATISAVTQSRSLSSHAELLITVYTFDSSTIKKTATTRFVISLETSMCWLSLISTIHNCSIYAFNGGTLKDYSMNMTVTKLKMARRVHTKICPCVPVRNLTHASGDFSPIAT